MMIIKKSSFACKAHHYFLLLKFSYMHQPIKFSLTSSTNFLYMMCFGCYNTYNIILSPTNNNNNNTAHILASVPYVMYDGHHAVTIVMKSCGHSTIAISHPREAVCMCVYVNELRRQGVIIRTRNHQSQSATAAADTIYGPVLIGHTSILFSPTSIRYHLPIPIYRSIERELMALHN